MESRINLALEKFMNGYNCSQAVVCTYCDLFGMDEKTAFRISEGFGAGMGGLQDTCGAVTGMFMVASLKNSDGALENGSSKKETYPLIKEMADEFKEINSSTICRDLLKRDGSSRKRSCAGCVEDACKLIEKYLFNN